jgi:type IV fimbrial biogenesis protein FimU
MKNNRNTNNRGFTMLEMMIVVVIIGIFASMAVPSFLNYIPKMKLRGESKEKVNYLRQARSKAITDNSQYGVFFDVDNDRIVYFKDTGSPELSTYNSASDSLMHAPIPCGANVEMINSSLINNCVIFYANGSASTSGSIMIHNSQTGDSYTISLLASTGRIRMN